METILHTESLALAHLSSVAKSSFCHLRPCFPLSNRCLRSYAAVSTTSDGGRWGLHSTASASVMSDSVPPKNGVYIVGDYMTIKKDLHVVKTTTTVDEALEALVKNRITGFPVIDDNWKLVGLVSDYDLLALDSISGRAQNENSMFPEADSTWKTFNEVQKLLNKTKGKVVGDLMTPAPLVVRENSNLEDAARLLLKTKYRRLPVVDGDGKLVGIITRGNVVRAALKVKRATEMKAE